MKREIHSCSQDLSVLHRMSPASNDLQTSKQIRDHIKAVVLPKDRHLLTKPEVHSCSQHLSVFRSMCPPSNDLQTSKQTRGLLHWSFRNPWTADCLQSQCLSCPSLRTQCLRGSRSELHGAQMHNSHADKILLMWPWHAVALAGLQVSSPTIQRNATHVQCNQLIFDAINSCTMQSTHLQCNQLMYNAINSCAMPPTHVLCNQIMCNAINSSTTQ